MLHAPRRPSFPVAAAVLLAVGLGLAGTSCSFTSPLDDAACETNADCPNHAVCQNGFCVQNTGGVGNCVDRDDDGAFAGRGCTQTPVDCDDNNANIHPEAEEACDSLDNDCDGKIDEAFKGRGGDALNLGEICRAGKGICERQGVAVCAEEASGLTCAAEPGQPKEEVCNGRDDDCNGKIDDVDGEMPIDHNTSDRHCGRCGNNCLDLFPRATGTCKEGTCHLDTCEDHYFDLDDRRQNGCEYFCEASEQAAMNGNDIPSEDTTCDGIDDDCDGEIDEDVEKMVDGEPKTVGDECTVGTGQCERTGEFVCAAEGPSLTCNVEPGRSTTEVCDGMDNDCNGKVDDGPPVDATVWYRDEDGDGYGVPSDTTRACSQSPPSGYGPEAGDCAPNNATVHPGAQETCNDRDDNCDGRIDEGVETVTWYIDSDGDGYGDPSTATADCNKPGGSKTWVSDGRDCDDGAADVHPGAEEICDETDNNCNMTTDEGCDDDGDGYCDIDKTVVGNPSICPKSPSGTADDCDDSRDTISPGAAQLESASGCMKDADGDGYGDASPPSGVDAGSDCDDSDGDVNPDGTEICDDRDNDCDGSTDEGCDDDRDGYCDASMPRQGSPTICPLGGDDCDDEDAAYSPGAEEVCDGNDNDCDGTVDEASVDGGGSCGGDCQCYSGSCNAGTCAHRMFVTSERYDGNLGGLSGATSADAKCAARAAAENLDGDWTALLSDGNVDARDRVQIDAQIQNMNGTKIADDANDLWDGGIDNAVDYDETATDISTGDSRDDWVWTGSRDDGRNNGEPHCSGWSSNNSGDDGTAGDAGQSNSDWLNDGTRSCDQSYHLYCIDGQ